MFGAFEIETKKLTKFYLTFWVALAKILTYLLEGLGASSTLVKIQNQFNVIGCTPLDSTGFRTRSL